MCLVIFVGVVFGVCMRVVVIVVLCVLRFDGVLLNSICDSVLSLIVLLWNGIRFR